MSNVEQRRLFFHERVHAPESGEGVISAAIAVLVMAFLGVAMWAAFNVIFDDAQETVREQVGEIGGS